MVSGETCVLTPLPRKSRLSTRRHSGGCHDGSPGCSEASAVPDHPGMTSRVVLVSDGPARSLTIAGRGPVSCHRRSPAEDRIHWSGSAQWRHRVVQNPSHQCEQCSDVRCEAALCEVCREEPDTLRHVLLCCPALMVARLRLLSTISPCEEDVGSDRVVSTLVATYRSIRSRSATPR